LPMTLIDHNYHKLPHFGVTVCTMVRRILSDRCLSCPLCPVLSVCLWRWCIVA